MSGWVAKRFWKDAFVTEVEGGFGVNLDTRSLQTPAKSTLVLPSRELAQAVADEWNLQEGEIHPQTMPMTRSANAAIDKVGPQHAEIAELIAAYGDTDLVCYRADQPASLVARQREAWDPVLDWLDESLGVRLNVVTGVMHVPQDAKNLERLAAIVRSMDAFTLTAFHDLVSLSGSLAIGLAALDGWRPVEKLWQLSRVDELWQQELWGQDEEATASAEFKRREFMHAMVFLELAKHPCLP